MSPYDPWKRLRTDAVPTAALEARIAMLVDRTERGRVRRPPLGKLAAVAALTAGVVAIALLWFPPRPAVARTLRHALLQLESRPFHQRTDWIREGSVRLTGETWSDGKRWRTDLSSEEGRSTSLWKDGRSYVRQPNAHSPVVWQRDPSNTVSQRYRETVSSLHAAVRQLQARADAVHDGGFVLSGGRRLRRIVIEDTVRVPTSRAGDIPGRRTMLQLDPATDLPVASTVEVRENGRWVLRSRSTFAFLDRIPEARFELVGPGEASVDLDRLGRDVGARFASPLAQQRLGQRTIAIRRIDTNRDGDLVVLYTDGSTPQQDAPELGMTWRTEPSIRYLVSGAVQTYLRVEHGAGRGLVVDGQTIKALALMPEKATDRRRPKSLVLTLQGQVKSPQGVRWKRVAVRLPIPARSGRLLPDYAAALRLLALDGGDQRAYRRQRGSFRRMHLWNARDWRALVAETDREIADDLADPDTFLSRAEALQKIGRQSDAQHALDRASQVDKLGLYDAQIAALRRSR
jgi:hypothetical protein